MSLGEEHRSLEFEIEQLEKEKPEISAHFESEKKKLKKKKPEISAHFENERRKLERESKILRKRHDELSKSFYSRLIRSGALEGLSMAGAILAPFCTFVIIITGDYNQMGWGIVLALVGIFLILPGIYFGGKKNKENEKFQAQASRIAEIPGLISTARGTEEWELSNIDKEIEQLRLETERKLLGLDQKIRQLHFEVEQKAKGLVRFVSILGTERWGTPEQVKEWRIMDIDMRNGFASLSPRQFEKLIASLFQKMGFATSLTSKTADYGTDIIARKDEDTIVIEAKRYSKEEKVGNRDIQRLLGSMLTYKANKAIFVTSSSYTTNAHTQAKGTPIELWDFRKLCQMIEKHML